MTFAAWLSVATICILGAMTPGPSLAVVLRYSVGQSRQAGFACAVAHGLGVGFYAVITMTGLGILFQTVPAFRNIVSVLGALYLIYLAIRAWRAAGSGARFESDQNGQVADTMTQAARDGFMIAFLNPKIALFFLALFSQFVSPEFEWGGKFLLAFTAAGIDAAWYCLVAVGLSHGAVLPWLRAHSMWIERIIAVLFVVIAMRVLIGILPV
ncbi:MULTISPECIES: LysE family translocator [Thalassospira]|jgi:threonine/homoserine/homoserine lactone efflux protein|uniref:Lysine transporter LysE n=1 Tax=Thalassospira xiamenensis TaxID=220697 RepID=A0ABR5Y5Z2_9PROT|nr:MULTISPECIES: LysE family translocator [Thalassospira]KZD06658.1 lysine transporter LysE [Thalassospira xiamenensis]KZD10742.1 lysine transporter LysE [Thalassospira xiamenensis]MAB32458.1 LysE family translocator [Thalassospira sp.]MBL4843539.1 LysE family translocator [Thalassospira sp.]MCD1592636.1 LysE family translocator [Thalassospira xiamenensis]|tara:strand:- start:3762 stop:4394 length:633 start_codon:yes stop_codon:yes gene_type:complete